MKKKIYKKPIWAFLYCNKWKAHFLPNKILREIRKEIRLGFTNRPHLYMIEDDMPLIKTHHILVFTLDEVDEQSDQIRCIYELDRIE